MGDSIKELNLALNQLYKKQDDLYHEYAAHHGLSDMAFWILYSLCTAEEVYTQNKLAEMWHFPSQSINSAVSTLVNAGYVRLEKIAMARNNKAVKLTEAGEEFCRQTILSFYEIEDRALLKMSEQDRNLLLSLLTKQYLLLKEEIETSLYGKSTQED